MELIIFALVIFGLLLGAMTLFVVAGSFIAVAVALFIQLLPVIAIAGLVIGALALFGYLTTISIWLVVGVAVAFCALAVVVSNYYDENGNRLPTTPADQ